MSHLRSRFSIRRMSEQNMDRALSRIEAELRQVILAAPGRTSATMDWQPEACRKSLERLMQDIRRLW